MSSTPHKMVFANPANARYPYVPSQAYLGTSRIRPSAPTIVMSRFFLVLQKCSEVDFACNGK